MVDEILRSLSRLNGQAQDILIHKFDTSDFRAVELMRFTMEQCQNEMESLRIKMDKIVKMMEPSVLAPVQEPIQVEEVVAPPAPAPTPEPPAPPVLAVPDVPVLARQMPERKPRIKIHVPPPPEVEKQNVRISFPAVARRR